MKKKPVLLLILDGWGLRDDGPGNAVEEAHTVHYRRMLAEFPHLAIQASEAAVGLPEGQIGNSEVGHMTMGAGRILYQDLVRINKAIDDGSFFENPVFCDAIAHVKKTGGTLHLMGLVSDGGVHSHVDHLAALIQLAKDHAVEKLSVHAFLDGRDVPPRSAKKWLEPIEALLMDLDLPQISTVSGRYYAMDRDNRWERVEQAYHNLVLGAGKRHPLSLGAVDRSYAEDVNDEFVLPVVTDLTYEGMADGDAILFFNFRPDRAREITRALTQKDFDGFDRQKVLTDLYFGCMCMYDETWTLPVAYAKQTCAHNLAEVLSERGLTQFHTAETEKYAHVTFFFNGGREAPYPGEDRKLIPSPHVATYDLQPEMSLAGVTQEVVQAIEGGQYDFIIANFANPDMVGHTGVMDAALQAVQAVDHALGQVMTAILAADGVMLLTADHGNIEQMVDENGQPHTAHTLLPVPCILVSNQKNLTLQPGDFGLSHIAPTLLDLMGLPQPAEMTSPSMLARSQVSV